MWIQEKVLKSFTVFVGNNPNFILRCKVDIAAHPEFLCSLTETKQLITI